MTRRRIVGLIAIVAVAVASTVVLVFPTPAQAAAQCTTTQTPPAPPEGGAVLWSSPVGGGSNTLILNSGDSYGSYSGDFSELCDYTVNTPLAILVSPGAALVVAGDDADDNFSGAVVPWGGITVPRGGIIRYAPGVDPMDFSANGVQVLPAAEMLARYGSCRQCVLSPGDKVQLPGVLNSAPGPFGDGTVPIVAYSGDASGLILNGASLTGNGAGYDFDGADLSRGTLAGNFEKANFHGITADRTVFGPPIALTGSTFDGMKFQAPPSFSAIALGGPAVPPHARRSRTRTWSTCRSTLAVGNRPGTRCLVPGEHRLAAGGGRGHPIPGVEWHRRCGSLGCPDHLVSGRPGSVRRGSPDRHGPSSWKVVGVPLDLTGARLDGATLTRRDGTAVTGIDLGRATLTGASLTNISAAGASFQAADLRAAGPIPRRTSPAPAPTCRALTSLMPRSAAPNSLERTSRGRSSPVRGDSVRTSRASRRPVPYSRTRICTAMARRSTTPRICRTPTSPVRCWPATRRGAAASISPAHRWAEPTSTMRCAWPATSRTRR